jgi:hypothetical protein
MDIQISRDYMALMYNILFCNELCPTATSIQITERRQDVPYISVFNTMVLLQHLRLGTCAPNIVHGQHQGTKFIRTSFQQIVQDSTLIGHMDVFFYENYGKGFDDYLRFLKDIELTEYFRAVL